MLPVTNDTCRFAHKLKIPLTGNQQLTGAIRSYSEKVFAHNVQNPYDFRAYN
jgi:hypothetical protein